MEFGLEILAQVKDEVGVPVITDIHEPWQAEKVGLPLHPGAERLYREKGWMK